MPADISGYLSFSVGRCLAGIVLFILFSALCCFYAGVRTALEEASPGALKGEKNQNSPKYKRALRMLEKSKSMCRRADAGIIFHGTAAVGSAGVVFVPMLEAWVVSWLPDVIAAECLSALAVLSVCTVLLLVFGCWIPRRLTQLHPEKVLLHKGGLFLVLSVPMLLFVIPARPLTALAVKLLGKSSEQNVPDHLTEEKILMMVDEGEENGTIEENTRSMIENVFDFDDTTVGEIMTHRKDVIAVRDNDKLTKVTQIAIESGRSRIPVYHEDIDDIMGIIYVKDLLKLVGVHKFDDVIDKSIIREAVYVPESKRCSEMFQYMTSHKIQIAVVVDEFGGTGGIITMEDLIESILGSIQDEYDDEDEEIKRVNENSFRVDGATSLDEISDLTGLNFEDDKNDTIAGVMLDRMGHIPKSGEHPSIMINGVRFTVLEVEHHRISTVLVVKPRSNAGSAGR